MRPSNAAWIGLAAGVIAYDVMAPDGETMSDAADRAIEKHPALTIAAVGAVALHVLNVFDAYGLERFDIIHRLGNLKERA